MSIVHAYFVWIIQKFPIIFCVHALNLLLIFFEYEKNKCKVPLVHAGIHIITYLCSRNNHQAWQAEKAPPISSLSTWAKARKQSNIRNKETICCTQVLTPKKQAYKQTYINYWRLGLEFNFQMVLFYLAYNRPWFSSSWHWYI